MARLREPVAGGQAVVILIGTAALLGAQRWLGGIGNPLGWFALVLALELVVQPLSTLVHELGHAAAVVLLGRRRSLVIVGRGPWIPVSAGRVSIRFSVLPSRGVLMRGLCRYDPRGISWRSLAWIFLAGPIATFLLLLVVAALSLLVWDHGPWVRYLVVLTGTGLTGSLMTNLRPRRSPRVGDNAIVAARDGDQARHAFAQHRAGARPPVGWGPSAVRLPPSPAPGSPLPAHWAPTNSEKRRVFEAELRQALQPPAPGEDPVERRRLEVQLRVALTPPDQLNRRAARLDQQRDRDRAMTSIPPPTRDGAPSA